MQGTSLRVWKGCAKYDGTPREPRAHHSAALLAAVPNITNNTDTDLAKCLWSGNHGFPQRLLEMLSLQPCAASPAARHQRQSALCDCSTEERTTPALDALLAASYCKHHGGTRQAQRVGRMLPQGRSNARSRRSACGPGSWARSHQWRNRTGTGPKRRSTGLRRCPGGSCWQL